LTIINHLSASGSFDIQPTISTTGEQQIHAHSPLQAHLFYDFLPPLKNYKIYTVYFFDYSFSLSPFY